MKVVGYDPQTAEWILVSGDDYFRMTDEAVYANRELRALVSTRRYVRIFDCGRPVRRRWAIVQEVLQPLTVRRTRPWWRRLLDRIFSPIPRARVVRR